MFWQNDDQADELNPSALMMMLDDAITYHLVEAVVGDRVHGVGKGESGDVQGWRRRTRTEMWILQGLSCGGKH